MYVYKVEQSLDSNSKWPAYQNILSTLFSFSASARCLPPLEVMLLAERLEHRNDSISLVVYLVMIGFLMYLASMFVHGNISWSQKLGLTLNPFLRNSINQPNKLKVLRKKTGQCGTHCTHHTLVYITLTAIRASDKPENQTWQREWGRFWSIEKHDVGV